MKTCPNCSGKGYMKFTDDTQTTPVPCPVCQGMGKVADDFVMPAAEAPPSAAAAAADEAPPSAPEPASAPEG